MRIGGRLRLFRLGPFSESLFWTNWRSKSHPRGPVWHGELEEAGVRWKCLHNHKREDTAISCADSELRRRARGLPPGPAWRRS
jgi:hypothetical protein